MNDHVQEKFEMARKWITTLIVIVILPIGGLWMKANRLEILSDVQNAYLARAQYEADRKETSIKLDRLDIKIEGITVKLDAVLQNQSATQEHLKAVESRIDLRK